MYKSYPSQRRQPQQDWVPRELAAQIAHERDVLLEELRRARIDLQRGEQERAQLQQHLVSRQRHASQGRGGGAAVGGMDRAEARLQEMEQALLGKQRELDKREQRIEAERAELRLLRDERARMGEEIETLREERDAARYTAEMLSPGATEPPQIDEEAHQREIALKVAQAVTECDERNYTLLSELLGLRDSLERAYNMSNDPANPWRQGLGSLLSQLDGVLTHNGLAKQGEVGASFDPSIHEAIGVDEREGISPGEIVEMERPGFIHEPTGRLMRTAQVIVSR